MALETRAGLSLYRSIGHIHKQDMTFSFLFVFSGQGFKGMARGIQVPGGQANTKTFQNCKPF